MFGVLDWIVFLATLVISAGIGIYHAIIGGKQKTTNEFLMGDRKIGFFPVAMSILVSFQSAIMIIGVPAEIYTFGVQYYLYVVGYTLGGMLAAVLFVPLFHPLKLTSLYEYLERRYKSKATKMVGSLISIIVTLIYGGLVSFAPSIALKTVSGFPEWCSFILIGIVVTFYTFMGGLKAVVWVDAFQAFIMFAGLIVIVIRGMSAVGGIGEVFQINANWERINFWNFNVDPTLRQSFWSLTFASLVMSAGTHGCSQASIQRVCAVETVKEAKQAIMVNLIANMLMKTLACLSGLSVFAYYASTGCDPLVSRKIFSPNQIIPYFVSDTLSYPGISGLFIACLYSGALSSLSSNLSSLCALTWEDIIKQYVKDRSEKKKAWVTRILVFVYGTLGIIMSFVMRNLKGTVLQASLSFIGAAAGPLTGIVVLGAFFPGANWKGAISGSVASYIIMMWIGIGKYQIIGVPNFLPFPKSTCSSIISSVNTLASNLMNTTISSKLNESIYSVANESISSPPPMLQNISGVQKLYQLSFLWYPAFGLLICLVVGLSVSYLTGAMDRKDRDSRYIISLYRSLCCCLPCRGNKYTIGSDGNDQKFADSPQCVQATSLVSETEAIAEESVFDTGEDKGRNIREDFSVLLKK